MKAIFLFKIFMLLPFVAPLDSATQVGHNTHSSSPPAMTPGYYRESETESTCAGGVGGGGE